MAHRCAAGLADQRAWPRTRSAPKKAAGHLSLWQVVSNKYVLAASLIYAGASGSSQVLSLWQPQIIKSFGLSNMETGLVNSIPFGIASVLMIFWGRNSDRTRERTWHTAIPLLLLAVSLSVAPFTSALLPGRPACCVSPSRPPTSSRGRSGRLRRNGCRPALPPPRSRRSTRSETSADFWGAIFSASSRTPPAATHWGCCRLPLCPVAGFIMVLALSRNPQQDATAAAGARPLNAGPTLR